ncbi:MAG: hypothetical protein J1F60_03560 [Oscillospiraceae bacterium]|nr:hypothetical protein [Oscillospiraceae bacterium]
MAEKRKTAITIRIVWFLVILFLLTTVISQLVIHYYNPLKTEPAELYTSEDYIQSTGIYIREEKTVTYSGSGVINYIYSDGEKLARNSVIAEIYASQNDLAVQLRIDELNEQIKVLRDAEKLVGSDNSQLEAFSNQIYENHTKMIQYILDGDYAAAANVKSDYLNLQSKRQIVNGTTTDYSAKIAELQSEISLLSAQISSRPTDLTLQETGYFVSTTDGYENSLTYDVIPDLTEDRINEIIKNPNIESSTTVIGKIVSDYKWKMVCIVPANNTLGIYEGATLSVRIGNEASIAKAMVEDMKILPSGSRMIVLSFDVFNQSLVRSRTAQIKIMFDEYSGIRIPSAAVHFDDEEKMGVFIKLGVTVYFVYIDMIRTEGDYVLVRDTTDKEGYLSLYDSVIVEGTDLYDGKIVLQ